MSVRTTLPALLLGGCLLVAEPPPGAEVRLECDDLYCPDGFTCDPFWDRCAETCDTMQPCKDGFECVSGACLALCEAGDCPDHLACRDDFECQDTCSTNEDCLDDYKCCTATKAANDKCDRVGACFY